MTSLWHDLRFALRNFRKQPGFTAIACITLALAIGANTAIFSLVDALFLQPLPVPHANELVSVYQTSATVSRREAALAIGESAIGIRVALLSARFLSSFLYGVQPISAGIFGRRPRYFWWRRWRRAISQRGERCEWIRYRRCGTSKTRALTRKLKAPMRRSAFPGY